MSQDDPTSHASPADPRRPSRWRKLGRWLVILYLVYVAIGFLVLPPIIKWQMGEILPGFTKRHVTVEKVRFNPIALSFAIEGLSLTETNGEVFASLGEFYVNFQCSSLFRWAWTFDELRLREPYGHVILQADGRFNFENLIPEIETTTEEEPPGPGKIPAVLVRQFQIQDAALEVDDFTHRLPLHAELKPINLGFTNLTTRVDEDSPYRILVASDSFERIAWTGRLQVDPLDFQGQFIFENGRLGHSTPVVRDYARLEIIDGRLDARLEFRVAMETNGLSAVVTNSMAELTNLRIKDLNTDELVSRVDHAKLGPLEISLQDRTFHVGKVEVEGVAKVVRLEPDGKLNFNSLIDLPAPTAPSTNTAAPGLPIESWTISVGEVSLAKSVISFADLSRGEPFQTSLGPIEFRLTDFSTAPDHEARYEYALATEAGESVAGFGGVSLFPVVRAHGEVHVRGLDLTKYKPYYAPFLHGELASGRVSVASDYSVALSRDLQLTATVTNAGVLVTNLQVQTRDPAETVFAMSSLAVSGVRASLADQAIDIGLIRSFGGRISVRQEDDGSINLLKLLPEAPTGEEERREAPTPEETPQAAVEPNPAGPAAALLELPWDIRVREIDFENYALDVEDLKPTPPARLAVDRLGFRVENITLATNAAIDFAFATRIGGAGAVTARGQTKLFPPHAELAVEVHDLNITVAQPYVNEFLRLQLAGGRLQTEGRVTFDWPTGDGEGLPVTFQGDVGLTDFLTKDQAQGQELVRWDALHVRGIDVNLQPQELKVDEIEWKGFHANAIIDAQQQINLLSVLPESGKTNEVVVTKPSPASNPSSLLSGSNPLGGLADSLPPVEVGALVLEGASFRFVDQSIQPACTFVLKRLDGSLQNLTTREDGVVKIDLTGQVSPGSSFGVRGQVRPLARELSAQMGITCTNTDLRSLTPYLEKYAGHPLRKGHVNVDLQYDVRGNDLSSENRIQVGQLTLGARNDSPDATPLPVKLAVALLKDRRGNIEFDVPVGGQLDNPEFAIMPIVVKTVMNLIVRAAASPFSLLSAALGGSGDDGEELSYVAFAAGKADIPPEQAEKLDKLIRALYERPSVNVDIAGHVDTVEDRRALAEAWLSQELTRFITAETNRLQTDRVMDGAKPLLAPPEMENGWLAAYYFRCAETNLALLPETNLVALLTGSNLVQSVGVAMGDDDGPGSNGAMTTVPIPAPEVKETKVKRHQYFSLHKGAFLLRDPGSASGSDEPPFVRKKRGLFGRPAGPPAPEEVAAWLGLSDEVMRGRLLQATPITEETLRDLMSRRARAVESYLLQSQKIERQRLLVVMPDEGLGGAAGQSRVEFTLN